MTDHLHIADWTCLLTGQGERDARSGRGNVVEDSVEIGCNGTAVRRGVASCPGSQLEPREGNGV